MIDAYPGSVDDARKARKKEAQRSKERRRLRFSSTESTGSSWQSLTSVGSIPRDRLPSDAPPHGVRFSPYDDESHTQGPQDLTQTWGDGNPYAHRPRRTERGSGQDDIDDVRQERRRQFNAGGVRPQASNPSLF